MAAVLRRPWIWLTAVVTVAATLSITPTANTVPTPARTPVVDRVIEIEAESDLAITGAACGDNSDSDVAVRDLNRDGANDLVIGAPGPASPG